MCDLFRQFLLALRLSAGKSEIKKTNSNDVHWNFWANIKTFYARNNIFKKRIPNMRFLNHLYFGPNFPAFFFFCVCVCVCGGGGVLGGTALERFSSSTDHSGRNFCSDPPKLIHWALADTFKQAFILVKYLHNELFFCQEIISSSEKCLFYKNLPTFVYKELRMNLDGQIRNW